ncbi:endonuclease/exonuclease/phosphatase family protein [Nocardioides caricicola]|uniref:Endonuclease/exonuclease/phosphatase family protein n=1 Tax=Nocardioides caricicola TaxID=634770 RepID=A0ABW0N4N9_9ACTN
MTLGLSLFAAVRASLVDLDPSVPSEDLAGQVAANLANRADDPTPGAVLPAQTLVKAPPTKAEIRARQQALAEKRAKARDRSLARAAGRIARSEEPQEPIAVRVGTFNVLGSQHTAPGGDRRRYPPASVRSPKAAGLIAKHDVDIVGTQELQTDQLAALQSRTGMAAYPGTAWGSAETDNSILYDDARFQFVSGSKFTITFMGRPRPQPILQLRDIATGREFYVVNTHPSAGGGRYATERRSGQQALVGIVNQLKATGLPVLVTGDMNDRELFYCNVVPAAGMTAANGGSYASGCVPPPSPIPVDWVAGAGSISWSGYWRDTSPITSKISDHFFISATAQIG